MKSFNEFLNESAKIPPNSFWVDMEYSSVLDHMSDIIDGLEFLCIYERKINSRLVELMIQVYHNAEYIGWGMYTVDMLEGTDDEYKFYAGEAVSAQGKSIWQKFKTALTAMKEIRGRFMDTK